MEFYMELYMEVIMIIWAGGIYYYYKRWGKAYLHNQKSIRRFWALPKQQRKKFIAFENVEFSTGYKILLKAKVVLRLGIKILLYLALFREFLHIRVFDGMGATLYNLVFIAGSMMLALVPVGIIDYTHKKRLLKLLPTSSEEIDDMIHMIVGDLSDLIPLIFFLGISASYAFIVLLIWQLIS